MGVDFVLYSGAVKKVSLAIVKNCCVESVEFWF